MTNDHTFNSKSIKYMGEILKRSNIGLLRYDPVRDECIKYPYPVKYDCCHLITTSIDKQILANDQWNTICNRYNHQCSSCNLRNKC